MNQATFGAYIRKLRELQDLPLRKVAAELDIDTSTLSKIERSDRMANAEMLPILSSIFSVPIKELQIQFISTRILDEFGQLEFLEQGLKATQEILKEKEGEN